MKRPNDPPDNPETEPLDLRTLTEAVAVEECPILRVMDGASQGLAFNCSRGRIRIGSATDNDVVLRESWVSRHHAEIEPDGDRLLIRDLGSKNGTFVNGVRVQSANIDPGARVQLGKTTLECESRARKIELEPAAGDRFGRLLGGSAVMRQIYTLLERIAPSMISVLISGPTGAGKDVVARTLHEQSPRRAAPLLVLDCGAADPGLISAEIFGHEAGAFTGATGRRPGIFEQAKGGTVFLDELGELPLDLQPKLLRVLETRELRRLGGTTTIPLDVRVVAATNRDLEWMCAKGQFRQDLYWRLCQVRINLPPLDQHREDIPLLAARILEEVAARGTPKGLSTGALQFLTESYYPGNIRQLKNLLEKVALLATGPTIEWEDLLPFANELTNRGPLGEASGSMPRPPQPESPPSQPDSLSASGAKWRWGTGGRDRDSILAALNANDWNLTHAARALGIALNTLKSRMARFDITRERPGNEEPKE
jgi:DNA-binding NtrC family response regulator